jgi:hypothetical protein
MLDPWIIEEILRREQDRRRDDRRIEMPQQPPRRDRDPAEANPSPAPREDRGVVVIDI